MEEPIKHNAFNLMTEEQQQKYLEELNKHEPEPIKSVEIKPDIKPIEFVDVNKYVESMAKVDTSKIVHEDEEVDEPEPVNNRIHRDIGGNYGLVGFDKDGVQTISIVKDYDLPSEVEVSRILNIDAGWQIQPGFPASITLAVINQINMRKLPIDKKKVAAQVEAVGRALPCPVITSNNLMKPITVYPLINQKYLDNKISSDALKMLDRENIVIKYMKFMETQYDGYPELNFAAILQALAIISDKRCVLKMAQQYIYPNMWFLLLGASTLSRKTTGMKKIERILKDVGVGDNAVPQSFSPEGFIEFMSEHSHAYYLKDEMAGLLAAMQKSYMSDFRDLLMELYDGGDYKRKLRTKKGGQQSEFAITDTFLNCYMATTPENFQEYATTLDVLSGYLLRFIIMSMEGYKDWMGYREETPDDIAKHNEIVGILKARKFIISRCGTVNIRLDKDGWAYFNDWQKRRELSILRSGDRIDASIFGRLETYAIKLAMLFTLGDAQLDIKSTVITKPPIVDPQIQLSIQAPAPVSTQLVQSEVFIKLNELKCACRLVDEMFLPSTKNIVRFLEEDADMKWINKVRDFIYRNATVSRTILMQNVRVTSKKLNEYIAHLIDANEILTYQDISGTYYAKPNG